MTFYYHLSFSSFSCVSLLQVMMALSAHLGSLEAEKQKLRAQVSSSSTFTALSCALLLFLPSATAASPGCKEKKKPPSLPSRWGPSIFSTLHLLCLRPPRCGVCVRRTSGWGTSWPERSRSCRTESRRWWRWRSKTNTCSSCPLYANTTWRNRSWWGMSVSEWVCVWERET